MPTALAALSLVALGLTTACDKVPLLAPTGSTIALSAPVSILAVNGTTQITANVISSGGQAVHNGTTITFTSNLGTFQPAADVQTLNGRATVTFNAGGQSGTANITATSGAANVSLPPSSSGGTGTGTTGGTTTTPTSLTIKIGGAAVSAVSLNANPATVSSGGGTSTITATVLDANGNALSGVPVSFTTDHGSLSTSTATSNASGQATTKLTTAVKTTVTATAGSLGTGGSTSSGGTTTSPSVIVDINAAPTVTITTNTTTIPTIGQLVTFTLVVTPAATGGSAISKATIDFGDGNVEDLGALTTSSSGISVSHSYTESNTYLVKLTVTDASDQTISTSVPLTVAGILKVELTADKTSANINDSIQFTATVQDKPADVTIENYTWDFGDGATLTGGSAQTHSYVNTGTKTIKVTVTGSDGSTGTATLTVSIS